MHCLPIARFVDVSCKRRRSFDVDRYFIPPAVAATSFYAYAWLSDKPLTSAIAFASLAWFDTLKTPLWSLPLLIQNLVQINISFKWVTGILESYV
jgi:hypothetical protein